MSELMMLDGKLAVPIPGETKSTQMQKGVLGTGKTGRGACVVIAPENHMDRNNAIPENAFLSIDIPQKKLERAKPLFETRNDRLPLVRGEDVREQITHPGLLSPRIFADDVESDTHLTHGGLHAFIERSPIARRKLLQKMEQPLVGWTGLTPFIKNIVPMGSASP